jgi:hypothetical protein
MVKIAASIEGGEAARGQGGAPATRSVRGGVEGATTENIAPIFEEGATQSSGRGPRRAWFARWGEAMNRRPNAVAVFTTGC